MEGKEESQWQATESHVWDILDRYFATNHLAKQQIDSYNRFVEEISTIIY